MRDVFQGRIGTFTFDRDGSGTVESFVLNLGVKLHFKLQARD